MAIQPSSSASAKHKSAPQIDPRAPSLRYESIGAAAQQLADNSFSAVQLCKHVLAAVDKLDGSLEGDSQVLAETALDEAAASGCASSKRVNARLWCWPTVFLKHHASASLYGCRRGSDTLIGICASRTSATLKQFSSWNLLDKIWMPMGMPS